MIQRSARMVVPSPSQTVQRVPVPKANRLVDRLSSATRERLGPHLQMVHMARGRLLVDAGEQVRHAYFPLQAIISLLGTTEAGETFEVAMIGHEGFVGAPIVLQGTTSPYRVVVQTSGDAYRVNADVVRLEFERSRDLHRLTLQYVNALMRQMTQSGICIGFHPLKARLARWLLMSRDQARSSTIECTQEFIADLLGASRQKVSQALVALEADRIIYQRYRRIKVVDAKALEQRSCECYRSLKDLEPESPKPAQ